MQKNVFTYKTVGIAVCPVTVIETSCNSKPACIRLNIHCISLAYRPPKISQASVLQTLVNSA